MESKVASVLKKDKAWRMDKSRWEAIRANKEKKHLLSWEDQGRLLKALPKHLKDVVLFALNTGCRPLEMGQLQWQWEMQLPELKTSLFVIPGSVNGRLIILNRMACAIIDKWRGKDQKYVFFHGGKCLKHPHNNRWEKARDQAGLEGLAFYDLRRTFEQRLKVAGVNDEDRQLLLGKKTLQRKVKDYSSVEIKRLLMAAEKICKTDII